MGELGTATRYEAFIRKGAKVNYLVEWHPGDGAPFLGPERFVKKISNGKSPLRSSRRAPLKNLIKNVAVKSGLSADILLRKGRLANVVQMRDRFHPRSRVGAGLTSLRGWRNFLLVIRAMSLGRCRRVSRLRQVCHGWPRWR